MKQLILLTLTLAMSPLFADEDIRSKVEGETKDLSSTIDPGKHIYGHAFGISEDDFISAEGKPSGYRQMKNFLKMLNATMRALAATQIT